MSFVLQQDPMLYFDIRDPKKQMIILCICIQIIYIYISLSHIFPLVYHTYVILFSLALTVSICHMY